MPYDPVLNGFFGGFHAIQHWIANVEILMLIFPCSTLQSKNRWKIFYDIIVLSRKTSMYPERRALRKNKGKDLAFH
jgi:hypothetical protein